MVWQLSGGLATARRIARYWPQRALRACTPSPCAAASRGLWTNRGIIPACPCSNGVRSGCLRRASAVDRFHPVPWPSTPHRRRAASPTWRGSSSRPPKQAAMLDAAERLLSHRRADERGRHRAASSRCTRRCRPCRRCALRLRDDVVTEADQRERQPAQRAGGRGRPVPGAEGDRMSAALHELGVAELGRALAAQASCPASKLTQHLLARIAAARRPGRLPRTSTPSVALAQAARRRRAPRRAATRGPLLGVPIAHKDIFVTRDFADHRRLEDAGRLPQPVRRHRGRAAGATPAW